MKRIFFTISLLVIAFQAVAVKNPQNGLTDNRIKTVVYNERDIVRVHGHYGYATHIQLGEGEEIELFSIGDSLAWQVVPKVNHIFLKPLELNAETNLTVLTNKRVYNFELRARKAKSVSDSSLTFQLAFRYPKEEMAKQIALADIKKAKEKKRSITEAVAGRTVSAMDWNFDYSMKGDTNQAPVRVFDDGEFTYFQFKKNAEIPAIFSVDSEKKESLLNFHTEERKGSDGTTKSYLVVQRVSGQFILRNGNKATCIFNDGFDGRQEKSTLKIVDSNKG